MQQWKDYDASNIFDWIPSVLSILSPHPYESQVNAPFPEEWLREQPEKSRESLSILDGSSLGKGSI